MFVFDLIEDYLEKSVVDFHGQFYSGVASWVIISFFGFIGFAYGYITESFVHTLKFIAVGTGVSVLACAFPWPFYSLHKLPFKKRKDD